MPEAATRLIDALQHAAKEMNHDRAAAVTDELVALIRRDPSAVTEPEAFRAARCLRRNRLFAQLEHLVEAYFRHATRYPLLRTLYAQALIDQDELMAALEVLLELLAEAPNDARAMEEARGLIGRVHKQAFVRAGEPIPSHGAAALRLAVDAYADAYSRAAVDPLWPAINLVACMTRARADGITVREAPDAKGLAREILKKVELAIAAEHQKALDENRDPRDPPWLLATGLEATLALDDDDATVAWGRRYLGCCDANAFEYGSTLRQLTELWRLHERRGRLSATVVPMLEAELLKTQTGAVVSGALGARTVQASDAELQAVWGIERFQAYTWLRRAVRNGDAVARVERVTGAPVGTGFLLRGEDLSPEWAGKLIFLTNQHVVDDPPGPKGVHPTRARIRFTTDRNVAPEGLGVERILWRSRGSAELLDAVVLQLNGLPAAPATLDVGDRAALQLSAQRPSRIYIIGHPRGEALSYSMYENELAAIEPPLIYYRSPTLEGSSGSPVFDPEWYLVAIHHSAVPGRQANRGTFIDAVKAAITADPARR
jgi:V8-like Glu-specific endopeptidase